MSTFLTEKPCIVVSPSQLIKERVSKNKNLFVNNSYNNPPEIVVLFNAIQKRDNAEQCIAMINDIDKTLLHLQDDMGYTLLMMACIYKAKDVILELLKYPSNCGLDLFDSTNETALMQACRTGFEDVVMEIYKHFDHTILDLQSDTGFTVLIYACQFSLNEFGMEILKYPHYCKMSTRNTHGYTALMCACSNKRSEKLAMEILKYPYDCGLGTHSIIMRGSALSYACEEKLENVALEIMKHNNKSELHGIIYQSLIPYLQFPY